MADDELKPGSNEFKTGFNRVANSTTTNQKSYYDLSSYLFAVANQREQLDLDKVRNLGHLDPLSEFNENNNPLYLAIKSPYIPTSVADLLIARGFVLEKLSYKLLENAPVDRIKYACEHLLDLELTNQNYNALHYVIKYRDLPDKTEVLEILLKHFVDVNAVNAQGNTPICSAIRRLDKKTVKYLLKQKIQPVTLNATQKNLLRIPPLQALELGPGLGKLTAHEAEMIEILKLLLDAGADVNGPTPTDGCTPLLAALNNNSPVIAKFFIERGAISSPDGKELIKACEYRYPDILKMLIERGAMPRLAMGRCDQTLFHYAIGRSGRTLTADENQALTMQLIEILAQSGVDINKPDELGRTPLVLAFTLEQFQMLQKYGADLTVKFKGNNLIHSLINSNDTNLAYVLSQGVVSVDEQNDKGLCPLHLATNLKKLSVVELLLKHNAKIDVLDGDGRTALMCAVSSLEIFETLLRHGADFMVSDNQGNNILHYAIKGTSSTFIALAKYMTKDQAQILVNQKNSDGKDPRQLIPRPENIFHKLLTLDIDVIMKIIDVFQCSKLFEHELVALARGCAYSEFDSSHWDTSTEAVHETAPIFALPFESIIAIILLTPVKDIASFSMTCRHFKLLCDNNTTWKIIAERDGLREVSTCQNVKKSFAMKWRYQRNVRQGKFYVRHVKLQKSATVLARQEENEVYGIQAAETLTVDCDLAARLIAVANKHGEVALIDMKSFAVIQEFTGESARAENPAHLRTVISAKDKFIAMRNSKSSELYGRSFDQEKLDVLAANCLGFSFEGDLIAILHQSKGCEIRNWRTKQKVCFIAGIYYNVVLNGHVVALWDQNQKTELWDINTKRKIFTSKLPNTLSVLQKFGKFIVSTSDLVEFIDCEQKISLPLPDNGLQRRISAFASNEDEQILLSTDYAGEEFILWQPYQTDITKIRRQLTVNLFDKDHNKGTGTIAITKDFAFTVGNYQVGIRVFDLTAGKLLYNIPMAVSQISSLKLVDTYLIAALTNDTIAIVNFNL